MSRLTRRIAMLPVVTGSPPAYDADASAYFARMATDPGATRKGLINQLFLDLKAASVYSKADAITLLASHEASTGLLNLVSTSYPLSTVNGPTFTVDRGYQGDGSSSYLTVSGYNQSVAAGKQYATLSASVFVYVNASTAPTTANANDLVIGTSAADEGPRFAPFSAAGTTLGRLNGSGTNVTAATGVSTRLGIGGMSRTSSGSMDFYRSTTAVTVASTSTGNTGTTVRLLNQSGSVFSPDRVGAFWIGGGLSTTEAAAVITALTNYLTAIGAN